jgi:hypothetical protein
VQVAEAPVEVDVVDVIVGVVLVLVSILICRGLRRSTCRVEVVVVVYATALYRGEQRLAETSTPVI